MSELCAFYDQVKHKCSHPIPPKRTTVLIPIKAYFTELQTTLSDSGDKRGKRHNLSFVLTSFLMAILRSMGQVDIASLHRWMVGDA